MPILNDSSMDAAKLPVSSYGYSHVRIDSLGATEYTLATIVIDTSGSTGQFRPQMEAALKQAVEACRKSPRADNLMLRVIEFADHVNEIHGFKMLSQCNPGDYTGVLGNAGVTTILYDACINAAEAVVAWGKQLTENDYAANAVFFVITDGMDYTSCAGRATVKASFMQGVSNESLESVASILIGVNVTDTEVAKWLNTFNSEVGFSQYVELDNADAKTLAKLGEFVSKSISASSQALGTGGPSQALTF